MHFIFYSRSFSSKQSVIGYFFGEFCLELRQRVDLKTFQNASELPDLPASMKVFFLLSILFVVIGVTVQEGKYVSCNSHFSHRRIFTSSFIVPAHPNYSGHSQQWHRFPTPEREFGDRKRLAETNRDDSSGRARKGPSRERRPTFGARSRSSPSK